QQVLASAGLPDQPESLWSGTDAATNSEVLANHDLAVVLSTDARLAGLSIVTLPDRSPILLGGVPVLLLEDGTRVAVLTGASAAPPTVLALRQAQGVGDGAALEAGFATSAGDVRVRVELGNSGRSLTYQVVPDATSTAPVGAIAFFDAATPATLV